jgi:GT2 family glycosyltransferase
MIGLTMAVRNRLELTQAAVLSVPLEHQPNLVIVDDGSTDGTREWLTSHLPANWIDGKDKPGISAKWNFGIERHLKAGASHVAVLNNDILLSPVTIDGLLSRVSRPGMFASVGYNIKGVVTCPEDTLSWRTQVDEDVHAPDWGAFMLSRECLEKVGLFDEKFTGVDFEDIDYIWRIERAGGLYAATRLAPYYHYVGGCKAARGPEVFALHQVNRAYFNEKWSTVWPL